MTRPPLPRLAGAALAALLAVTAAAPARAAGEAGCGGVEHVRHAKHVGHGRAPLIIGDSVLLGAMPQVARTGWDVDAHGCRPFSEGLDVLRRLRHAHRLPPLVALQLGTNASITTRQIAAALRIMGPSRVLVLLTPREVGGGDGSDAAAVRAAGRLHPDRVLVVDWARRTQGHGAWFQPDGIHLMPGGAAALARMLRPALRHADGTALVSRAGSIDVYVP